MIQITFPDGSKKEFNTGVTAREIAESISPRLLKEALAAKVNGKAVDLGAPIQEDATIEILTFQTEDGKEVFWHSAEHVLTVALKRLFPDVQLAMGPPIENGFYADFDSTRTYSEADFEKIEAEVKKVIEEDLPFTRKELSVKEAQELFKKNPYKQEWLKEIQETDPDEKISAYFTGDDFVDLCTGPHVPSTGKIKNLKLTRAAGAYWRGDSNNKMLQRLYGIAFPKKSQLDEYIHRMEEALKRDHRKLGKELGLFSIHEEGPGFPFFLPKGLELKNILIDFWRKEHRKAGYQEISTPVILNRKLWETSKHWFNYKENMYTVKIDEEDFAIKPMNCPGGMLVYKEKIHSYRELPLRVGELGVVHRHELSGVLAGLFRVRVFTQDDAHIYMTENQMESEVFALMDMYDKFYKLFGFKYKVELSTRPEKAIGTDKQWEFTTETLRKALEKRGMPYKVNEGDGAFYGPKIDFHLEDCIGRTWQCGTIQLDMSQPENFDLTYMGEDGTTNHRPVMLHRVVYGSLERFMGILIEHFAGKFPLWISPVHVKLVTVADRFLPYAKKVQEQFENQGLRTELDDRAESVSKKVRDAQMEKVPLILTIGEKEEQNNTIAVRTRDNKIKFGMEPDELIRLMKKNIQDQEMEFTL